MALRQRARFSWKPARLRRYHREDEAPQQLRQVAFRALRRQIAEAWYRLWDLSTLFSFFIKAIPSTVRCGAIGGSEPRAAAKVLDAAGRPSFLGGNFEKPGYPDGRLSICYNGVELAYRTFDKIRQVDQGAIADNKRLGPILAMIRDEQLRRGSEGRSGPRRRDQRDVRLFKVG